MGGMAKVCGKLHAAGWHGIGRVAKLAYYLDVAHGSLRFSFVACLVCLVRWWFILKVGDSRAFDVPAIGRLQPAACRLGPLTRPNFLLEQGTPQCKWCRSVECASYLIVVLLHAM